MAMSTGRSTKRRTLPKQPDVDAAGTWQSPRELGARTGAERAASYSWTTWAPFGDETGDHMSATETTVRECRHFIAGKWAEPGGGAPVRRLDPFTGDVVAHVAAGDRDDARSAVEAAAAAFPEWSQTPPVVRQGIFLKAADILEGRRDEIVEWLARETGCSFGFGMFQMGFVPGLFRQAAGAAYAPTGDDPSVRPAGRLRDGHAQAGRRGRRDRALERGAHPLGPLDRRTARLREHGRARSRPRSRRTSAAWYGARSSPRRACRRAC